VIAPLDPRCTAERALLHVMCGVEPVLGWVGAADGARGSFVVLTSWE
jgi:hypothetical protein